MSQKITDFEVINYSTTRLKVKSCTKTVPELTNGVVSICQQINAIAENFKKLTVNDMQSSDFIDMTNEIVNISNNTSDALKKSVTMLLNDAYGRISKIGDTSKSFADDLAAASSVFGLALDNISKTGNKVEKVSKPENNPPANTPQSQEATNQESQPGADKNQESENQANPPSTGSNGNTNVTGSLSPGTSANTFPAKSYSLSEQEYRALCATIYAEATENKDYCVSDTIGVTSVILNRVETDGFPNSVMDVISSGAFEGYSPSNRKFSQAMNDPSVIPPEMLDAINRTLSGQRNTNAHYFAGNGTYNKFR